MLRTCRLVPLERKVMRGVFKRLMLRNRISVVAKNACCRVSNQRWEDRKQREEKDT